MLCTCLTLVEHKGKEMFYCSACIDDIDHRTHKGETGLQPKVLGSDIHRGKAPSRREAAGPEVDPAAGGAAVGHQATAAAAAAAPPPRKPPTSATTPLGTYTSPRTPCAAR